MGIKNIRDEIIKTAGKMFLEKPYADVAMRDIANVLGISVGNLTYHFNKKEMLVEAVVLDVFSRYKPNLPCSSLEELDAWVTLLAKSGEENAFYFKDFEYLAQISQAVRDIQRHVFEQNMLFWRETLKALRDAAVVELEGFEGQDDAFIHNFYLIKARWNEQRRIEAQLGIGETGFRLRAWASIYPMLTAQGRLDFKEKFVKD